MLEELDTREIHERIFVGDKHPGERRAVVHACKRPCHQRAVGYSGNLSSEHPDYLYRREDDDLYLNMVDVGNPRCFGDELFEQALEFMQRHWDSDGEVLVHCSEGESRAPSIGLLFLAARIDRLPKDSFASARRKFEEIYPEYLPNDGIEARLAWDWSELLSM